MSREYCFMLSVTIITLEVHELFPFINCISIAQQQLTRVQKTVEISNYKS